MTNNSVDSVPISAAMIISSGESEETEFKATLRTNLHTKSKDPRIELAILKTIAGFMNTKGGRLVIGVTDDGVAIGLSADKFENEDKFHQHLDNLVIDRIGPHSYIYLHTHFEDYDVERVLIVECLPARVPMYVRDGDSQKFFVRTGNSSSELSGNQENEYITLRFRK